MESKKFFLIYISPNSIGCDSSLSGRSPSKMTKPVNSERSEVCFRRENDFLKFPFGTLTCISIETSIVLIYIDTQIFESVSLPYFMGILLPQILFYKKGFERNKNRGLRGYKKGFERNKKGFERVDKFINRLLSAVNLQS